MSWGKVKLGEICTIEKGTTGIQKAIQGDYPLVVTSEERKSHNEYQFDDEAVIIPLVSGTGHGHASLKRIHLQTGKFALGSILCAVIPKDKKQLSAEYLYRFLDLNKEDELVARMRGMANVTLPIREIAQIEIPLPPLKEQMAFVEKYKLLEIQSQTLNNELSYQLSLVKNLRQQFLQDAVQGKLVKNDDYTEGVADARSGNLKSSPNVAQAETGIDLLKRIKKEKEQLIKDKKLKKEKELPPIKAEEMPFEIPDDWVWCRLGEIAYDTEGGKSPNCLHEPAQGDEWGVIKTTAVQEMYFLENENKVLPKGFIVSEQHKVIEGDILITRAGPKNRVGIVCCVENLTKNLILSDKTIRIKHSKELLYSKFIATALNSPLIKPLIELKMTGMADSQVNISQDNMKGFLIPLPPLSIQHLIVEKIESLMQICAALETSIQTSARENEQLLQQVLREALQG